LFAADRACYPLLAMLRWSLFVLPLALACSCSGESRPSASSNGPVVGSYLEIQEKLSADSTEGLEALGATVAREAHALQGEGGVERIIEGARGFSEGSLEQSRLTFKKLSAGMIENLRSQ